MLCSRLVTKTLRPFLELTSRSASTEASADNWVPKRWGDLVNEKEKISRWTQLNEKVFEPLKEGEEPRPAYVCHEKRDFWYSFKKLYIVSCLVRGLPVDEAVKQLNFVRSKGAKIVKETILEAQELAIKQHNVEFKSNLWVAESFPEKAYCLKATRRHARARLAMINLQHCHYMVRLEEGPPPKHYYYYRRPRSPQELLDEWLVELRSRKIINSL
ncbi:39S ribosomal protein L22, mitochondrial [Thrips palmi]|uniref:Large ribosomal subunit protein uL22m n=1 Tax=Thrips palmi TaxID=161013 RepID=A0A6P8YJ36_THRPL|nr:39S ribosomal protein L22, mitochondrial [Thrips palmi]